MGPFSLSAAIGGKPVDKVKALILLSHGIGGSELGHSALAQALARNGYLVAALRHPGDNWQDRSLIEKSPERYFDERPRQASRVIDAILADPAWKNRIASDSRGPRVGALGHSAGGYTVLALAGARPDLSRIKKHCQAEASADPVFCGIARVEEAMLQLPPATSALQDERVRAIVAMAPAGVPLTAESLARVRPATMVYEAERDRFVVPRFHAGWVASNLPAANLRRVPNAWHFAFMDSPSMPIPSPDGDVAAKPAGFRPRCVPEAARHRSDHLLRQEPALDWIAEHPVAPLPSGTRRSAPTMTSSARNGWLVPAGLLVLSAIPIVAGTIRILQIATGAEITPENARFFAAPLPVVLHLGSSMVFCVLGAFQFSAGLRRRHLGWHRASGRMLVPCGLVAALSALWLTLFLPTGVEAPARFDGAFVYATRLLVGSAMTAFLCLGLAAVLRRDIPRHRAWMMRAYALGLGAGTQVFTHLPWFLFPSVQGELTRALCMAAGWGINYAVAEWLIAREQRKDQLRRLVGAPCIVDP